jgi:hypothetical protein
MMQSRIWSMKWLSVLLASALALASAVAGAQDATNSKARQNFVRAATLACLTVELAKDSPAKCRLEFINSKPVLLLSFEDSANASTYGTLALSLVGPQLCAAVKAEKNGASLALVDSKSKRASVYSCEQQAFTAWLQINTAKQN